MATNKRDDAEFDDDVPESMRQKIRDMRMNKRNEEAYDKAMPSPERYAKGGKVGSASRRADGIAKRGKTRGKMC